MGGLEKLA